MNLDRKCSGLIGSSPSLFKETTNTGLEVRAGVFFFLLRCTECLNLPSAARRLFEEDGKEILLLARLQRDQLVYVSCGEQWVNPEHQQSESLRRLAVLGLEQDVARIQHYCLLRSCFHDLVLDTEGQPQEGSALIVSPHRVNLEDTTSEESQVSQEQESSHDLSNSPPGDAHSRAHQRADERVTKHRFPWQRSSEASSEGEDDHANGGASIKTDKSRFAAVGRQRFEWTEGQLQVCCRGLWLSVGVRARDGGGGSADHTGSTVHLLPKNTSDPHQLWIYREEERTLHLQADPSLVLAVSMPQISHTHRPATIPVGWPVILQPYKPHSPAAANQRWRWVPEQRLLWAFYTDALEQQLTAARLACVCTACLCPQPLQQQGYYFSVSGERQRIEVCVSCATELRGKVHLQRLPPNSTFRCATANQSPHLNPKGPFRGVRVCETDLSAEAADGTLCRLLEHLERLRREDSGQTHTQTHVQTRSPGGSSAQPPVKILAHRNGQSRQEAQLITAATMPLLLAEATRRLGLLRAAQHLYTADGTRILTIQQLKAWALNQSLQEHNQSLQDHHPSTDTHARPDTNVADATSSEGAQTLLLVTEADPNPTDAQTPLLVTEADVDTVDQALLALVLREPIPLWVSCGEAFQPPDAVKQKEREKAARWMKKGRLCVDLEIRRHKMRQQKASQTSPCLISPTVGGASETTTELNTSQTHISVEESMREEDRRPLQKASTHDLYRQPQLKRVLVHCNGWDNTESMFVWGRTIDELLRSSTERLGLQRPASVLYTSLGEPVSSWAHVQRDAVLCVSAGEPFLTPKDCRDKIALKANFARAMRHHRHAAESMAVSLREPQAISVKQHSV
ncbi:hypothetical protein ACEWY4_011321 [Coilia grayii]|uniref:Doublecortin domain-containing protein n=1 Tax=Coilia grayii TaxID=363190 RepID=A0ABD1K4G3_9TELE